MTIRYYSNAGAVQKDENTSICLQIFFFYIMLWCVAEPLRGSATHHFFSRKIHDCHKKVMFFEK